MVFLEELIIDQVVSPLEMAKLSCFYVIYYARVALWVAFGLIFGIFAAHERTRSARLRTAPPMADPRT